MRDLRKKARFNLSITKVSFTGDVRNISYRTIFSFYVFYPPLPLFTHTEVANPNSPGTYRPPPRTKEVVIKGQIVKAEVLLHLQDLPPSSGFPL